VKCWCCSRSINKRRVSLLYAGNVWYQTLRRGLVVLCLKECVGDSIANVHRDEPSTEVRVVLKHSCSDI